MNFLKHIMNYNTSSCTYWQSSCLFPFELFLQCMDRSGTWHLAHELNFGHTLPNVWILDISFETCTFNCVKVPSDNRNFNTRWVTRSTYSQSNHPQVTTLRKKGSQNGSYRIWFPKGTVFVPLFSWACVIYARML